MDGHVALSVDVVQVTRNRSLQLRPGLVQRPQTGLQRHLVGLIVCLSQLLFLPFFEP